MGDDVFFSARDRFLAGLPEQDRLLFSPCAGRQDLLDGLEKLTAVAVRLKKRRGALVLLDMIDNFARRLEPFCKVIDTVVSSNPEIAALVWGGLRLVLQLASNYGDFFNRTITLLGRLGGTFPQYPNVPVSPLNDDGRIRRAFEAVYVTLFDVFHTIATVFVKSDGRAKSALRVVNSVIWRPFDARLSELLDRMAFQQQVVRDELNLFQTRAMNHLVEAEKQERALAKKILHDEQLTQSQVEEVKRLTQDALLGIEKRNEEDAVSRIQEWLAPPAFSAIFEQSLRLATEDSGNWFLEDQRFKNWCRSPTTAAESHTPKKVFDSRTLWIYGRPGCGKTVLSSMVINEMKTAPPLPMVGTQTRPEVVYYFFRFDLPHNDSRAALSAVMAQLLQMNRSNRALLDACTFSMQYSSHGQGTATNGELEDLIAAYMRNSPSTTYIVLDAIDEADDPKDVVCALQNLSRARSCRMLLFSRYGVTQLQRAVREEMRFEVDKAAVKVDIQLYLQNEIDELLASGLLPGHADPAELVDHLTTGADGMFLWARLMIDYLASPVFDALQRLKTIRSVTFPEGLEPMYNRICDLIWRRHSGERDLASRVLVWLTYSLKRLDTARLRDVIMPAQDVKVPPSEAETRRAHDSFEESVLWACAGLVERLRDDPTPGVEKRPHQGFRFIHNSAREYFSAHGDQSDGPWSRLSRFTHFSMPSYDFKDHGGRSHADKPSIGDIRRRLVPEPSVAHIELVMVCLRYLLYYVPAQPFFGDTTRKADPLAFRQGFPFASYAAPFWIRHLEMGDFLERRDDSGRPSLEPLAELLDSFLSKPLNLMSWIEAHYLSMQLLRTEAPYAMLLDLCPQSCILSKLARRLGDTGQTWRKLGGGCKEGKGLETDLVEFERDMQKLQLDWGDTLLKSPEIIWDEATAFTPSRFLLQTRTTQATSLAPASLESPYSSTIPLCVISEADPDGKLVVVLSIWPSRSFENKWNNLEYMANGKALRPACRGWVARCQIWSIEGSPVQAADIRILCNPDEIWLVVCQSLYYNTNLGWKISFPLAICKSCLQFVVLRTVFVLKPATATTSHEIQSFVLGLDATPDLRHIWSDARAPLQPFPWSAHLLSPGLRASCYAYGLTFSPNGHFLAFADSEFNMETHLLVWEREPGDALRYRPVALARHNFRQNELHLVFHGTEPLIILCDSSRLYRWNFLEESPSWVCTIPRVVSRLSISKDAAFAIIDDTIAPLYPSSHPRPVLNLAADDPHDTSNRLVSLGQGSFAISRTPFRPGEMIHATVSTTAAPQSGSAALPVSSSSVVTLEVATYGGGGGGEREILDLLALPRWHGLDHTFAVVQPPQDQSNMFRVLLHMAPASSYDMSPPPPPPSNNSTHDRHHQQVASPMVIDRHIGAIRRAAGNTNNTQPAADTRRLQVVRDNMGLIECPDSPLPVNGLESRTDMGCADTGSRDEEDLLRTDPLHAPTRRRRRRRPRTSGSVDVPTV
ncbi:hypothetical protein B0T24DRAFT_138215 [Lasiosphaeria ovina]|uniref:NACHT domain-containing protein n=1 Tax=Lasiosphaeria ovina TaxID=92902 RepID=A0AAE0KM21_9PEZI|nr:hypothetical protein B0T24DRAFT_138215 [Lasiosphaeria ovina]